MTMARATTIETTSSASPVLLLEIGTEEIPARFLPDALNKLKENAERIFSGHRIAVSSVRTYATPRRLALLAEVSAMQQASEREVWGPPVNAAFDQQGNPTKAAEAFARTNNIAVADLVRKEKGKGSYIVALIRETAQHTEALLPGILTELIASLHFPKSMRWGNGNFRFARPIHWILATYDNRKVSFEIDGIKSITTTRGHRFLAPAAFEIKDNKTYMSLLRNSFVIIDPEERKRLIVEGSQKLAASAKASLVEDEDLLQHVTFLVEFPVPVLGSFPKEYLSLPKELLITVMKGHQKYFALEDKKGTLVNYFIITSNTKENNSATVKKGAEKVLKARFEDARFYYEEDKKVPLKERLEGLKKVIYHDKLGTIYEKSQRTAALADFLARKCCPSKKEAVHTAALLSKTDLISGVVREFPELQGIMGGYYAAHEGYGEEVATAISEQYLPVASGGALPATDTGAVVSLSDKLDNVVSFFTIGLSPTGSEDPFALRRQALGSIAILLDKKYNLTLSEVLDAALRPYALPDKDKEAVMNELVRFFEQRLEPLFQSQGYPLDAIAAVMRFVKDQPLHTVKERLDALEAFKKETEYESFLTAIKRVNNIAPKEGEWPVDKGLFSQYDETVLHKEVESIAPQIRSLVTEGRFLDALRLLLVLREPINRFFDNVLIMDKDEQVKKNRLALVKSIQALSLQIADLSKLG